MDNWTSDVCKRARGFAKKYSLTYAQTDRALSAAFEIGCFHAIIDFYDENWKVAPVNLQEDGSFRYLTSPSGNPRNFSHIEIEDSSGSFHLRQQVRIRSHSHEDIAFTPDIVVVPEEAAIRNDRDPDFANGKRSFFAVSGGEVIAAHECKSMIPFPELLISFVGMFIAAHGWYADPAHADHISHAEKHLAPSLFVGGTASGLHSRMARAMALCYPINVFLGLHSSKWRLQSGEETIWTLGSDILSTETAA